MDTQKVDRVVTIWLMPSMMAFAMIAHGVVELALRPQFPTAQHIMVPKLHSAMSDAGPEDEAAQVAELGDVVE